MFTLNMTKYMHNKKIYISVEQHFMCNVHIRLAFYIFLVLCKTWLSHQEAELFFIIPLRAAT